MNEDAIRIGDWTFFPAAGELRRGEERRALEDRAARLLAILARSRGEVVSHDQLLSEVWNGRTVSPNSLAVVIGDLRRALDDSARSPKHIETVAKRGYRLTAQDRAARASAAPRHLLVAGAAVALLAVIGSASLFAASQQRGAVVVVADIANETGDARYAPLARAVREVVLADATRAETLQVRRAPNDEREAIVVSGRLVLWSGHPSVSLSATDAQTGEVIWSGMAPGPEDSLPQQVGGLVEEFANAVEER
jgi:DNA-binding winged helix-turn-helix (wHTH) protein